MQKIQKLNTRNFVMLGRALHHDDRLAILNLLIDRYELTVTDIWTSLRLNGHDTTCQHLAILHKQDLVKKRRDGKFVYYSINRETYQKALNLIKVA
jgi:DNA-binding transcriptional ArsR family regulator